MSFGGRVCFNCESKKNSDLQTAIGARFVPVAFLSFEIQAVKEEGKNKEIFHFSLAFLPGHLDSHFPRLLRL